MWFCSDVACSSTSPSPTRQRMFASVDPGTMQILQVCHLSIFEFRELGIWSASVVLLDHIHVNHRGYLGLISPSVFYEIRESIQNQSKSLLIMVSGLKICLSVMAFMAFMLGNALARPRGLYVPHEARGLPMAPSNDPFYQPPAGFESKEPGTILRQRNIDVAFLGLIPDLVEAYQLLYRTTAVDGSAIATVTTIFKPLIAHTDRFISFHTAYDSSATICDPSYTYQLLAPQNDLLTSAEMIILQAYLLLGYIVVSPDYEGPDAAFTPGHLEGMCVLDSMRAVSSFDSLGLSSAKPMIVGIGYSGGAIATGWAASLQPTYAPELDIKGWVQGGTPANLTGTLIFVDGTPFSGFVPPAVVGLSAPSAYGAQLKPIIDGILTQEGKSVLDRARSSCATGDLTDFFERSLFSTEIQSLGDRLLYDPTIQSILLQNTMGVKQEQTPTAPTFVYHASQDEVIPYSDAEKMVDAWCGYGANVKFTTYGNGGHVTTEIVALPDAIGFVGAAFAGTTTSGCSRNTELNSLLNPIALGIELEPILVKLIELLTKAGSADSNVKQNLNVFQETVSPK